MRAGGFYGIDHVGALRCDRRPACDIDAAAGSLEKLLEHAARDEADGLGDAPWPPHFRKMEGEGWALRYRARKEQHENRARRCRSLRTLRLSFRKRH